MKVFDLKIDELEYFVKTSFTKEEIKYLVDISEDMESILDYRLNKTVPQLGLASFRIMKTGESLSKIPNIFKKRSNVK